MIDLNFVLALSLLGTTECATCIDWYDELIFCKYGCCKKYDYFFDEYVECCTTPPLTSSSPATTAPTQSPPSTLSPSSASDSWSGGSIAGVILGIICFFVVVGIAIFLYRRHCGTPQNVQRPHIVINTVQGQMQNTSNTATENIGLGALNTQSLPSQAQGTLAIPPSYSPNAIPRQQAFLGAQTSSQWNPTHQHQEIVSTQPTYPQNKLAGPQVSIETQLSNLASVSYQTGNQPWNPQSITYQQQRPIGSQSSYHQNQLSQQPTALGIQQSFSQNQLSGHEGHQDTPVTHAYNQVPGATINTRQLSSAPQSNLQDGRKIVIVQSSLSY